MKTINLSKEDLENLNNGETLLYPVGITIPELKNPPTSHIIVRLEPEKEKYNEELHNYLKESFSKITGIHKNIDKQFDYKELIHRIASNLEFIIDSKVIYKGQLDCNKSVQYIVNDLMTLLKGNYK